MGTSPNISGTTTAYYPTSVTFPDLNKTALEITKPLQWQVGGDHYKKYPIQPFEYAFRNRLDYLQANVIKYVTRFRDKGGKQDLEKAIHTLNVLIEMEYGN